MTRYLEDFTVGESVDHRRGHTVCTADNQMLSLLTMNTAQTHYNSDSLRDYMDGEFAAPLLNACVALALAVGLTSDDMAAAALDDLGYDALRMPAPVHTGDTVYASSEVLAVDEQPGRPDVGVLAYRITARTASGVVLTVTRRVLVKRRSHWGARDAAFDERCHRAALDHLTATEEET